MSQSNIITSQFVKIDQSPAGIGNRILARIIDSIVQTIYIISMLFLFRFLISSSTIGNIIEFIVFFCPIAFYSFLCETFNNGQSLGEYIMKIRVVKKDGTQPGIGDLFMRWILELIDIGFSCIGIIPIMITKNSQRFGDLAAGTMVIKIADYKKIRVSLDEFFYARKDYTPMYPEVENLSFGQMEVIQKVIDGDYDYEMVETLTEKVKKVMGIEKIKNRNPMEFLTTVLHDYQFLSMELI